MTKRKKAKNIPPPNITAAEWEVLDVLWKRGPVSAMKAGNAAQRSNRMSSRVNPVALRRSAPAFKRSALLVLLNPPHN